MPIAPCTPRCSPPPAVNVPGPQGAPGVDGYDGINAFAILQAAFTALGAGTIHALSVNTSQWMAVGQVIVAAGPVHLVVVATPTVVTVQVTELGYAGDVLGVVAAGAKVSPAGVGSTVLLSGTATLVAGTVTVSTTLTAASKILLSRNTEAGTPGYLEAPAASRNAVLGSFVINSSSATDTSTVDWVVVG